MWVLKGVWIKTRVFENSVENRNVGYKEMLDKDYYENSHDKDSAAPGNRGPGSKHKL